MKTFILLGSLVLVASCDKAPRTFGEAIKEDNARLAPQHGRYQLVPASPGTPAMRLDTVTGCIDEVSVNNRGMIQLSGTVGSCPG